MLSLSRTAYDEILAHAESGDEEEICGILAGERVEEGDERADESGEHGGEGADESGEHGGDGVDESGEHGGECDERVDEGGDDVRVEVVHRATNVATAPRTRYRIDPEEQLAIIESIEDAGREVVGFYHSHPTGPAVPSETDAERAAWPGYSYAICVPGERPYLGSWRWTGETFEREAVALQPD